MQFKISFQRAFEKILADKEIKKNYNSELKTECEASLGKIFIFINKKFTQNF